MKWQPIETAPKDGTPFLAACKWGIGGDWYYVTMHYKNDQPLVSWTHEVVREPTHWKPIKQPKIKKKEQ